MGSNPERTANAADGVLSEPLAAAAAANDGGGVSANTSPVHVALSVLISGKRRGRSQSGKQAS